MSFFPISDGGDFFPFFFARLIASTYSLAVFLMVGKAEGGSAGAAQYKTSASVSQRKTPALKLKSQSKMERHLSSVFNVVRLIHCDVDKSHPGSTSGD